MKITAHTLVKNEQNWIWYALKSVIDHVDQILVWDTGSDDNTVEIIKSFSSPKIKFEEVGKVDSDSFTHTRQKMLEQTDSDWLMILDGDEIWPDNSISQTISFIRDQGDKLEYLIHPYFNLLGDVYHHQEPKGGAYIVKNYSGHVTIRFINLSLLPGLHFGRPHGTQGIFDKDNILIQDRDSPNYKFLDLPYLHTTHLHRSSQDSITLKRPFKYKYELGIPFPENFLYPSVFYLPRPQIIPSPWDKSRLSYTLNSAWQTPLKFLKRRLVSSPSGY